MLFRSRDISNIRAFLQVLLASVLYAWAVNMVSRKVPGVSGIAINGLAMSFATIIYLPFAITHLPENAPSSKALFATIGLGILCTAMAFWIFFIVLDEIGPARASLVVYPNTAIAVVLGNGNDQG